MLLIETPLAIDPTVPIEAGMTTMPRKRKEPLQKGAP
jgi:hypothetical protein